jgi:hypothetical protein
MMKLMTRKQVELRSKAYDLLFAEGVEVLKKWNPCKHDENGKCAGYEDGCCGGPRCEHLGPKGCTVQSLQCKLWLCYPISKTPDGAAALKELRAIEMRALELDVPFRMRRSKEQNFAHL